MQYYTEISDNQHAICFEGAVRVENLNCKLSPKFVHSHNTRRFQSQPSSYLNAKDCFIRFRLVGKLSNFSPPAPFRESWVSSAAKDSLQTRAKFMNQFSDWLLIFLPRFSRYRSVAGSQTFALVWQRYTREHA